MAGTNGTKFPELRKHLDNVLAQSYRDMEVRQGRAKPDDFNGKLATMYDTLLCTAILEAGRRSLDTGGKTISIDYDINGLVSQLREM